MKILTVAVAFAAMIVAVPAAQAFDYKAQRDFSYQNPAGVWSYGGRTVAAPQTFTPFSVFTSDFVAGSDVHHRDVCLVGTNTTGQAFNDPSNGTVVVPNNMLVMNPSQDEDAVVRFQVPATGAYRFQGEYQIQDTSPSGTAIYVLRGERNINKTVFGRKVQLLVGRGAVRSDRNPKGGKVISFDFTLSDLQANEFISFGLNANGDWHFDTTAFDVKVTPQ